VAIVGSALDVDQHAVSGLGSRRHETSSRTPLTDDRVACGLAFVPLRRRPAGRWSSPGALRTDRMDRASCRPSPEHLTDGACETLGIYVPQPTGIGLRRRVLYETAHSFSSRERRHWPAAMSGLAAVRSCCAAGRPACRGRRRPIQVSRQFDDAAAASLRTSSRSASLTATLSATSTVVSAGRSPWAATTSPSLNCAWPYSPYSESTT